MIDPGPPSRPPSVLSRRDALRLLGAAGAAVAAPGLLAACEPTPSTPMPLAPDPSVRPLGFVGGADVDLGPGAWCWFQSPRASLGPDGLLWMGASVAHTGTPADGAVKLLGLDTRSGALVVDRTLTTTRQDDHTSPSVLAIGDEVQVAWALHQTVDWIDIARTGPGGDLPTQRIHRPGAIRSPGRGTAYASAHVVAGQRWILYRGEQFSWNLLTSPDGQAWTARGLVVRPATPGDRPYVHAASDGDRLHLLVTNGNPTEFRGTCAYAGTIESDLTITRSVGGKVGTVGAGAPLPRDLLRLAVGVVGATEADDTDMWLSDLHVIDRRPTGILVRRDPWPPGANAVGAYRHRYFWVRQRSTGWVVEPLCWAGGELCPTQPDYAALGAQDPSLATRVVVSTNVHPVTGMPLTSLADGKVHFELFEGTRVGEGSWTWQAITADSVDDNVRPVIAAGGTTKSLAWMRGRYWSWTDAATRIVVRQAVVGSTDPPTSTSTSTSTTSTSTTSTSTTTSLPPTSTPSTTTSTTAASGGGPGPIDDGAVVDPAGQGAERAPAVAT